MSKRLRLIKCVKVNLYSGMLSGIPKSVCIIFTITIKVKMQGRKRLH